MFFMQAQERLYFLQSSHLKNIVNQSCKINKYRLCWQLSCSERKFTIQEMMSALEAGGGEDVL